MELHTLTAPSRTTAGRPPAGSGPFGFLFHYVRRHPTGHAVVLVSVVLAVAAAVSTQYGLKYLIDIVSHGPNTATEKAVWIGFGLLCGLIAADNLMWRVGGWMAARTFVAVTGDIRRDLFDHLSRHSPSYFAERLPGALAGRITAASNAAYTVSNTMAWNVLPPCIAVLCAILLIGTVDPIMAVSLLSIAVALGALIHYMARKGTGLHREFAQRAAAVDGELVDVVGNFGVVRAFGATLREQRRFGGTLRTEMASRTSSLLYMEKLRLTHAVLTAILTAGIIGWTLLLWQQGHATVGDIVLITSLAFGILHGSRDLAVALVDLTQHLSRLEEAVSALLSEHELPDRADARDFVPGAGRVRFENVRFAYPGRPAVLDGFDLTIEQGQRVGLVGFSGAGKSTVLALLQRFYDVEGGRITIDGQDVRDVTQDSLRADMAIVPQDISLFHRTVQENIRYARPEAETSAVLAAADMAYCRSFIEALPDGFATMVGDRGVKLSGGQRQRLAIARALLKDAPLLLLDEATSALDTESEMAIQSALDRLMRGRTVIAIAHRLSTLRSFDRIIVMDRGRIIDDGSPTELASRPGPYRELLRKQHMDPVAEEHEEAQAA
jgi:ATP-binding cassette subfamily B protein